MELSVSTILLIVVTALVWPTILAIVVLPALAYSFPNPIWFWVFILHALNNAWALYHYGIANIEQYEAGAWAAGATPNVARLRIVKSIHVLFDIACAIYFSEFLS